MKIMKNIKLIFTAILILGFFISCESEKAETTEKVTTTPPVTETTKGDLPDWQYVGYKIVHHMSLQLKHIEEIGFNKFDHPRIANYESFVITPALDHFYSKAVADLRNGPVVVNTPARDDRYSSLEVFDMEQWASGCIKTLNIVHLT
jgi:hypothetical protein